MRLFLIAVFSVLLCLCAACNETVDTAEQGGSNAVGIAETMSGGTIGETDMETGDSAEESEEEGGAEEGEGSGE